MPYPEFDHMSLDDLRVMLKDVVRFMPPNQADRQFLRRLTNAIAEREKDARQAAEATDGTPDRTS